MKIAIITAYCREPASILERCRKSVLDQVINGGHEIHQIMIADGHPQAMVDGWDVTHIPIPPQRDCGDTPRMIGAMLAVSAGYDAFSFLDADNWLEPTFIDEMTKELVRSNSDIVTCARWLWRTDQTRMGIDDESDGVTFNDTNCNLFRIGASFVLNAIAFKKDRHLSLIGDQVLWKEIRRSGLAVGRVSTPLVNYVTNYGWHYWHHNETPPPGAKRVVFDLGDGRPYQCREKDIEKRPDGTEYCPPERLMGPDGSRPHARKSS